MKTLSAGRALLATSILAASTLPWSGARAESLSDPMRPATVRAPVTPTARSTDKNARVTAIFISDDRRVAVLDGVVVREGDRIGELVVEEIGSDSVRYQRLGRSEIAKLRKSRAAPVRRGMEQVVKTSEMRP